MFIVSVAHLDFNGNIFVLHNTDLTEVGKWIYHSIGILCGRWGEKSTGILQHL